MVRERVEGNEGFQLGVSVVVLLVVVISSPCFFFFVVVLLSFFFISFVLGIDDASNGGLPRAFTLFGFGN